MQVKKLRTKNNNNNNNTRTHARTHARTHTTATTTTSIPLAFPVFLLLLPACQSVFCETLVKHNLLSKSVAAVSDNDEQYVQPMYTYYPSELRRPSPFPIVLVRDKLTMGPPAAAVVRKI